MAPKEQGSEKLTVWQHCLAEHWGVMQNFEMSKTGSYRNEAMLRQINEILCRLDPKHAQLTKLRVLILNPTHFRAYKSSCQDPHPLCSLRAWFKLCTEIVNAS